LSLLTFLNSTPSLPVLQRSLTPLSFPKKQSKLTPILALQPERNFINLPSGKFTRFIALSLKNIFNSYCEIEEADGENRRNAKVRLKSYATAMRNIPELGKFVTVIEDMSILHEKMSFEEILEIICSDASVEQIGLIKFWISEWNPKSVKIPILGSMKGKSRQIQGNRTFSSLTPKKH
jgi:hypothetical protein